MRSELLYSESLQEQDLKLRRSLSKRLRKKDAKLLFKRLKDAVAEKDVEDAWKELFSDFYIKNNTKDDTEYTISSPYNTDGFISTRDSSLVFALRILTEFKYKTDLTRLNDRCKILAQIIHYMHEFRKGGYSLPTILVGADESQVFILLATNFYKYLDGDYNWECSPSSAYKLDINLMNDLRYDANMSVFPFDITLGDFNQKYSSLLDIFESIQSIVQGNENGRYKIKVTPSNILSMFDQFSNIAYKNPNDVNPVESVNIFMQMLTGESKEKYYFIPANHNLFHLPGDNIIDMYGHRVESFFNHYDRNVSPRETDILKSIADRLIEANERRYKGDFWTPSVWCNRADEILKESLGSKYKDDCIVWDCASGVRNLTRDFNYSNLFISTYHTSEIMLGEGYNPEARKAFQYDFLNDDVDLNPVDNPDPNDWKMPNSLFNALIRSSNTNKRVLFYTNPPYGTANNVGGNGTSKSGISITKMNRLMKEKKYGKASQQLYAQFFARIIKLVDDFNLNNVSIGFFTKSRFFAGGDYWKKFNSHLFSRFYFVKGNYLNSGEFSDISDTWPITFSVYDLKKRSRPVQKEFNFTVEKSFLNNDNEFFVDQIGNHTVRTIYDDDSLRRWSSYLSGYDYMLSPYPQLSSALKVSKGNKPRGKLLNGSLGYEVSNSNNVGEGISNSGVWIVSGSAYKANGFNVTSENFDRAVVNFAARRCVTSNWINDPDNYAAPDVNNEAYDEFVNDSLIFTLFDNASYQAAYRDKRWTNIGVPGKWANEWFWLSKEYVMKIANKYNNNDIYLDAKNDKNRYVYDQINNRVFSSESRDVLKSATDVWNETFQFRQFVDYEEPDLYLNAWDAGWYQVKQVNHEYPSKSYNTFKDKFRILKSKLEKNVYILGMLRK